MSSSIILASGSDIRQQLLANAGINFSVIIPRVDEPAILAALLAENAKPIDIADTLADYKAQRVALKNTQALVIAADQILVCNGDVFNKPKNKECAKQQLGLLRGNGHQLLSAVVIYEAGQPVWRHVGRAQLVMRDFSDEFLDDYVSSNSPEILASVGCYQLENQGVQLFSKIQGDYFTILGLPLVEVLGFLRSRGVLKE